jgi:hypothetical protein
MVLGTQLVVLPFRLAWLLFVCHARADVKSTGEAADESQRYGAGEAPQRERTAHKMTTILPLA